MCQVGELAHHGPVERGIGIFVLRVKGELGFFYHGGGDGRLTT
jgi:hypothetical protein